MLLICGNHESTGLLMVIVLVKRCCNKHLTVTAVAIVVVWGLNVFASYGNEDQVIDKVMAFA